MGEKRNRQFDGLKGLAIIAIITYHLFPSKIPGGFLTVNAFFALSGYFFTYQIERINFSSQVRDWKSIRRLLIKTFERLFIPLFWMIGLSVIGLLFLNRDALNYLRREILSGLFFYNNFQQILADKSYFVKMTEATPFTHLWYNSLYLQSFILATVIVLLTKFFHVPTKIKAILWGMIVYLSHMSLSLIYVPGEDPSRVYYGLDTRFSSFAIGIMITYMIPSILNLFYKAKRKKKMYQLFGFIHAIGFLSLVFIVNDQSSETYYVFLPLYSVISMGVIFSIVIGVPFYQYIFGNPLFVWIGQRSYSYYLWYYPVMVFWYKFQATLENQMHWLYLGYFVSLIVLSELMFILIERKQLVVPFLTTFNWREDWRQFQLNNRPFWLAPLGIIFVTLSIFGIMVSKNDKPLIQFNLEYQLEKVSPSMFEIANPIERKINQINAQVQQYENNWQTYFTQKIQTKDYLVKLKETYEKNLEDNQELNSLISDTQVILTTIDNNNPELAALLNNDLKLFAAEVPVSFFGDSLILLSAPNALNLFLNGNYLGIESLQIWDAVFELQDWLATDEVKENLVVNLGTNAGLDKEGMEDLIEVAGDRKLFFVNTNSKVEHKQSVNDLIKSFANRYDNVYEIDWFSYAQGHPEFYWAGEDVHHTPEGANHFAAFVAKEMYKILQP